MLCVLHSCPCLQCVVSHTVTCCAFIISYSRIVSTLAMSPSRYGLPAEAEAAAEAAAQQQQQQKKKQQRRSSSRTRAPSSTTVPWTRSSSTSRRAAWHPSLGPRHKVAAVGAAAMMRISAAIARSSSARRSSRVQGVGRGSIRKSSSSCHHHPVRCAPSHAAPACRIPARPHPCPQPLTPHPSLCFRFLLHQAFARRWPLGCLVLPSSPQAGHARHDARGQA